MLTIQWPQSVSGDVYISGSKNAALPLIACGLFFKNFTLHNVPDIGDVKTFLRIIESLGVRVDFKDNILHMDTSHMNMENMDRTLIKKIRVGIFLFPALLKRFGNLEIPYPGWCNIWKRPITEHLKAFAAFGYKGSWTEDNISFSWESSIWKRSISAGFAVTATENALMMAAFSPWETVIHMAAIEPHVNNLIEFLQSLWVHITLWYDHSIYVTGISEIPEKAEWTVIADYIESGTFIILWALCSKDSITVHNARIWDLFSFLEKCRECGVRFELNTSNDSITVYNSIWYLQSTTLQTNIFPGFPTDLQSPFALLLSQAEGTSRIHEVLFEWRLNWLVELEKMKGHIAIMNPHEALIFGKTPLRAAMVSSWDLRAWVTMILAWLIAQGETKITNVEYIERWYEDIVGKILKLGATIETL